MTYAEILAEVILLTKRGDMADKIAAAIRTVTLRAHRLDYFWRDRIESQLQWAADQTIVDINVVTWLPRFRAINYARYWDPATSALGLLLDKIDPRDVLDEYNYEKLNRYYMAGDVLKIKFETPSRGIQVGYYCSPVVHPAASYSSWIADQFPDIIIQGAVAMIFNTMGKQEEARSVNAMVGFDIVPQPNSAQKGPTLVEQLRAYALEEDAR